MITLRSKFAGYRLREHQFTNGVCRVTEEQFEHLKNDPEYGKDFWREDEKAIARIVAENPIVDTETNAAGGESASESGEASKTPPPSEDDVASKGKGNKKKS